MSNLGKSSFVGRRKGSNAFQYRRRFPSDVAARTGKREFNKSLGTGIYADALKALPAVELAYHEELARLIGSGQSSAGSGIQRVSAPLIRPGDRSLPHLQSEQVEQFARRDFAQRMRQLDLENAMPERGAGHSALIENLEQELAALSDAENPSTCRATESAEARLLVLHGLRAEPSSDASRLLREYIRRSMLEAGRIAHARMSGDYSSRIIDQLFATGDHEHVPPSRAIAPTRTSLSDLIKLYEREHERDELSSKTVRKNAAALALVARFFGPEVDIATISRDDCLGFRDALERLPSNFTKKYGKEVDLRKMFSPTSEAVPGQPLNRQTQEHYIRSLTRLLDHADARELITRNPAKNLRPRGKSTPKEERRNSFSRTQLKTIFNAPLYTGCKDDERGYAVKGPHVIRRSRFWVPLIALFTGLRLNEILQLTADHVNLADPAYPFLMISNDMRLKTAASARKIPVHPELANLGFLELARKARERPGQLLFSDLPASSDNYPSSIFSKRFATFLKSLDLNEAGRKVSFHSFRHTFRDALRTENANPDLVDELGGWSRSRKVSSAYGDGAKIEVLKRLIDAVDYQLDLRHLYVSAT